MVITVIDGVRMVDAVRGATFVSCPSQQPVAADLSHTFSTPYLTDQAQTVVSPVSDGHRAGGVLAELGHELIATVLRERTGVVFAPIVQAATGLSAAEPQTAELQSTTTVRGLLKAVHELRVDATGLTPGGTSSLDADRRTSLTHETGDQRLASTLSIHSVAEHLVPIG